MIEAETALAKLRAISKTSAFNEWLGLQVTAASEGSAELQLAWRSEPRTIFGVSPRRTHWGAYRYGVRLCSCDHNNGRSGIPLLGKLLQAGCCKDIHCPRQNSETGQEANLLQSGDLRRRRHG